MIDPEIRRKLIEKLGTRGPNERIIIETFKTKQEAKSFIDNDIDWTDKEISKRITRLPSGSHVTNYDVIGCLKEAKTMKKLDPQRPIEKHLSSLNEEIDQIARHLADLWIKGEESTDYKHKEYHDEYDWVKGQLGDAIFKNVDFAVGQLLTWWERGQYPYQRKK